MNSLKLTNVFASYGSRQVLHGISMEIPEASITLLLGANGAGKSTTLRAICGMNNATGKIEYQGKNLIGKATHDVVRMGIAHVPEGRGTFVQLTVEENLRVGAYLRNKKNEVNEDIERVYSMFPRLKERANQTAGTLSGGEQQMLALGRALMLRPKLLLIDEPSMGLAPKVVESIFKIIADLNAKEKITILLIEQNTSMILDFSHQFYLLESGKVVTSGVPSMLKESDEIRKSYLGY